MTTDLEAPPPTKMEGRARNGDGSAGPWLSRDDRPAVAMLLGLSLVAYVGTAVLGARRAGIPIGALGAYFDGNLYLEIAKSFPAPYGPGALDYAGQSPGYPALIFLIKSLAPGKLVSWGTAALLASWGCGAAAAVAFYRLCVVCRIEAFWPSVVFAIGLPYWLLVSATAHSETLAVLLVTAALLVYLRGLLLPAALLLAGAVLTRHTALLITAALGGDLLLARRRIDGDVLRHLLIPAGAWLALNAYLWVRIPGFSGVPEAHRIFWDVHYTIPFHAFVQNIRNITLPRVSVHLVITYTTLVFYVAACVVGLRSVERGDRVLAFCVVGTLLFHASLSGPIGVDAFTRLTLLAWPPALLLLWRRARMEARQPLAASLCVVLGLLSVTTSVRLVSRAVAYQNTMQPHVSRAAARLDEDRPEWKDLPWTRSRKRQGQRR